MTHDDQQADTGRGAMGAEATGAADQSGDQEYHSGRNEAPSPEHMLSIAAMFGPWLCNAVDGDSDRRCRKYAGHAGEHWGHGPVCRWTDETPASTRLPAVSETRPDLALAAPSQTPPTKVKEKFLASDLIEAFTGYRCKLCGAKHKTRGRIEAHIGSVHDRRLLPENIRQQYTCLTTDVKGESSDGWILPPVSLAHLAQSLFFKRKSDADCVLAMIAAYYDDSGSHGDTKSVVACGFVSDVDQWLRFEKEWTAILALPQFDLEHLHMKELRSGKGRFAKFRDNLNLQKDLFERLHNLLRVRTRRTFAGSVILDDYDRVNRDFQLAETVGPPLVLAAEMAIMKTMRWWKNNGNGQPISLVVDQGMRDFSVLSDHIYVRYGFRIIPATVAAVPPLQAADLAAWEIHRVLHGVTAGTLTKHEQIRGSFAALLTKLNLQFDNGQQYTRLTNSGGVS